MRHALFTFFLGPILLFQGLAVRRRTPVLPEPTGERHGVCGEGTPLNLLVTGDSAAAGVGAEHQQDALTGRLVEDLAARYRVQWTLHAETGATTSSILESLQRLEGRSYDVVVTSLGVNDVTAGARRSPWRRHQAALRKLLADRFNTRLIIASGLPPVHRFPALPQPLRWYLGRRATQFDCDLQEDISRENNVEFLSLRFSGDHRLMAPDGFHPGPEIYAAWARRAGGIIRKVF